MKKKLTERGIQYEENNSVEEMLALGITEVPVLGIEGDLLNFKQSVDWINNQIVQEG